MADRSVIVTGGGRGMGFAISKAIAQMGGNITCVDENAEPVPEFHELPNRYGTKAIYKRADVTRQNSSEKAFTKITNERTAQCQWPCDSCWDRN